MSSFKRPKVIHTLLEGRTFFEFSASTLSLPFLLRAPTGPRHGVMVLPGFLASDTSTAAMRRFLKMKGYQVEGWKLGRNLGQHLENSSRLINDVLLERVLDFYRDSEGPVSLIGWSLGGILAREVARLMPEQVRQVITLGSPFQSPQSAAPMAARMFRFLNRKRISKDFSVPPQVKEKLIVPCTAIYSKTDGIAHWHGCRHHDIHPNERAENIEVKASHLGYGHHPGVLWLIAKRLSMPAESWQPIPSDELPIWLYPRTEHP
ncbi:MAG: thioesterase domain-containing protein [Aestuariibacter sp.]